METNITTQKKRIAYSTTAKLQSQGDLKESSASAEVNVRKLRHALEEAISGEVRFDRGSRALYAADASNYRQIPIGLVIPKNEADIEKTVAICRKYKAPLLSRGGGTSLAGQCCNVAVVLDMSKYHHNILDYNTEKQQIRVQSGTVLDAIRKETEKDNLTFGPDPATHNHCTIGGMIGNNSCGIHSIMAQIAGAGARTSDNLEEMTVLTYDGLKMTVGPTSEEELEKIIQAGGRKGEIYRKLRDLRDKYANLIRERFPDIPRRVSGYNLDELLPEKGFNVARALCGSESTCVVVLDATLNLIETPNHRSLLVLGYDSVFSAGKHAPEIFKHKPIGLEGLDAKLIGYMRKRNLHVEDIPLLPKGEGWLLVEFGGKDEAESDAKAKKLMEALQEQGDAPAMRLYDDQEEEKKVWEVRESGLGATAFVPGEQASWPGWEDSAVPPEKVGPYLRDLEKLFDKYGYSAALYGHFGQGCIHCRINFDLVTAQGIARYHEFTNEAAELVLRYGGSLSGEHGDGQSRAELLEKMYGPELVKAFQEFKAIWDPEGKMNPGKVVHAYTNTENLRLGNHYNPKEVTTHFKFTEDNGSFAHATLRCVGVGECRRQEGGTMCPSWRVTHEEKHTTRGRAHMLFEMLQGDVLKNGWKDDNVKESLDLCLSCKGCKGDCPVQVDMATYKSEFLSHYYKGRLRPRTAFAFGFINFWGRLASLWPEAANFFTQTKGFAALAKYAAGVSQERKIPEFASQTFRAWFKQRPVVNTGKERVLLWVDTFNNNFHPETLIAATEVLEKLGFQVALPKDHLCCGRPLYDFGMLDTAKSYLRKILNSLKDDIEAGTLLIGLEPSCTAVFRDEMKNLFPHDAQVNRFKQQVVTFGEFLDKTRPDLQLPALKKKALVHGHCHHKAIMGMHEEKHVLKRSSLDYEVLDSGCCGMAGNFGFEAGKKHELSLQIGEQKLLPAVREADADTLIIADGFSCREQIRQQTDRQGLHLAEVVHMAMEAEAQSSRQEYPEQPYLNKLMPKATTDTRKAFLLMGIGAVAALFVNKFLSD